MSKAALAAVIFDMDGVLVDSEPFWQEAEIAAFDSVGVELTRADCTTTMGMRVDSVVAHWLAARPWNTDVFPAAALVENILDRVVAIVSERGEPIAGALESVDCARRCVSGVALASSSPLRLINATLHRLGLDDAFDAVCSAELEARGKPHPDVYLSAARILQVEATECLAIEDSDRRNGLGPGSRHEMRCRARCLRCSVIRGCVVPTACCGRLPSFPRCFRGGASTAWVPARASGGELHTQRVASAQPKTTSERCDARHRSLLLGAGPGCDLCSGAGLLVRRASVCQHLASGQGR